MCSRSKLLLFVVFFLIAKIDSLRILSIFPMPSKSHYILAKALLKELATNGHQVTSISPYPLETPMENFRDISVAEIIKDVDVCKRDFFSMEHQSVFDGTHFMTGMGLVVTETTLAHPSIQNLMKSDEKFDLVIVSQFVNEGLLAIAQKYQSPIVLLATMPLFSWYNTLYAQLASPAYVPNILTPFTTHMTFWQRFLNTAYDTYGFLYHQFYLLPKHRELVQKYVPNSPDFYEYNTNFSLVLLNSHPSVYGAVPHVPNAVEIGGFHIDNEIKALPDDIREFIEGAEHGVILFSMGSNMKSTDMPVKQRGEFAKAFGRLKQRVLWKWEDDANRFDGLTDNVKLSKWLPQNDILAHSNVKLFISHGGLLSTMESIYHGMPIIGIPIFVDQKMNVATAVANGYAISVSFSDLTAELLLESITEIITNPKYRANVQERSRIMRDQQVHPLKSARYWVEYVHRHRGAKHLRYAGMDLNWYQRALWDVYLVILLIIIFFVLTVKRVKNVICRSLCKGAIKKHKKRAKQY